MNIYYITGLIMLIVGVYVRYEIGRRRFYRRGPNGLQHFKNYRNGVLITMIENLLLLITITLVIGGILVLAWGYRINHINDNPHFEVRKPVK